MTLHALPDGSGIGGRQTTLEASTYTVTFADLDGGVSFTFDGCPG